MVFCILIDFTHAYINVSFTLEWQLLHPRTATSFATALIKKMPTILIVDSEPKLLDVLTGLFETSDFEVSTASDAVQALEILRKNPGKIDIVFADADGDTLEKNGFDLVEKCDEMRVPIQLMSYLPIEMRTEAEQVLTAGRYIYKDHSRFFVEIINKRLNEPAKRIVNDCT